MAGDSKTSAEFVLRVNEEERGVLLAILEHELGEVRAEAYRTDNPDFHDSVVHRADVIRGLVEKFQQSRAE